MSSAPREEAAVTRGYSGAASCYEMVSLAMYVAVLVVVQEKSVLPI